MGEGTAGHPLPSESSRSCSSSLSGVRVTQNRGGDGGGVRRDGGGYSGSPPTLGLVPLLFVVAQRRARHAEEGAGVVTGAG